MDCKICKKEINPEEYREGNVHLCCKYEKEGKLGKSRELKTEEILDVFIETTVKYDPVTFESFIAALIKNYSVRHNINPVETAAIITNAIKDYEDLEERRLAQ